MILYILPQNLEKFQNRLNKMLSKFSVPPTVTYSEPKNMKAITMKIYDNGYSGRSRYIKTVNVIEVEIEDICMKEWYLVASVFYQENRITMGCAKYFGDIPEQYGLNYTKCDYCGKTHSNRKDAHILYNKITNEWMQVGSACVNKMFDEGKYFSSFTEQLYKIVEINMGCCGYENFPRWCASLPDNYFSEALQVDDAIAITKMYYDTVSTNWQKSFKGSEGTTAWLNNYYNQVYDANTIDSIKDYNFIDSVKSYVATLDCTNEFDASIMEVFKYGYVNRFNLYTIFFGIKKYMDSITVDSWESLKLQYKVGDRVNVVDAKVLGMTPKHGFYGWSEEYVFEDQNKIKFMKNFSGAGHAYDFENANGLISFSGIISGYNDFKRAIVISGRVSKIK